MKKVCENCRWGIFNNDFDLIHCHYYPPKYRYRGSIYMFSIEGSDDFPKFPVVKPDTFCSKFESRTVED